MITYFCMFFVVAFLGALCLYKAGVLEKNEHFFDITSTTAMRGFWCLVVILVHVPVAYGNKVQDLISSFGYIGVTFFFMTSGYGLKVGFLKNGSIKKFWRRRLPKLLIPMFWVNVISFLSTGIIEKRYNYLKLVTITGWVQWLLICYFVFWLFYRLEFIKYKDTGIILTLVIFSSIVFITGKFITSTTWVTEIYGFIWGILLANHKSFFERKALIFWKRKVIGLFFLSGIVGVLYIKYKHLFFVGNYLIKIALGFIILLFILQLVTRIQVGNSVANFIGKISYEVYLIHSIIFYIIESLIPHIESGEFIVIAIICTIVMAFIVNAISKKCFTLLNNR